VVKGLDTWTVHRENRGGGGMESRKNERKWLGGKVARENVTEDGRHHLRDGSEVEEKAGEAESRPVPANRRASGSRQDKGGAVRVSSERSPEQDKGNREEEGERIRSLIEVSYFREISSMEGGAEHSQSRILKELHL